MAGPHYFSPYVRPPLRAQTPQRCAFLIRTYRRNSHLSFGEFVSHFFNLWRFAEGGVSDCEAADVLLEQMPPEWKEWASRTRDEMLSWHPVEPHLHFSFPNFVAELLTHWTLVNFPPGPASPTMSQVRGPWFHMPGDAPIYTDATIVASLPTIDIYEVNEAPPSIFTTLVQEAIIRAPPSTLPPFPPANNDFEASGSRPAGVARSPSPEYTPRSPPCPPLRLRRTARKQVAPPPPPVVLLSSDDSSIEVVDVDSSDGSFRTLDLAVDDDMDSSEGSFHTRDFEMDEESEPSEDRS